MASPVARRSDPLGAGRRGGRLGHHDRLRVIDGCAAVDDRTRVVGVVVRPISPGPGNRGNGGTGPVAGRPPAHRPIIPRVVPVAVPIPVIPVAVVPIAMRWPDEVVRPVDVDVVADVRHGSRRWHGSRRSNGCPSWACWRFQAAGRLPGRLPGVKAGRLAPVFCGNDGETPASAAKLCVSVRLPIFARLSMFGRFPAFRRLSQLGVLAIPGRSPMPERLAPRFCDDGRNAGVSARRGVLKL